MNNLGWKNEWCNSFCRYHSFHRPKGKELIREMKKKLSNLSEQEIEKLMWNADMTIETRCEWCTQLGKNDFCLVFGRKVDKKANRFCAYYSPE